MATNPLANATTADMKWAFPEMNNPTIIDLNKTGDQTYWNFSGDQDVIFIGPTTPRTSHVQVDGGHNVVILGGEYAPVGDTKSATLQVQNVTGNIHVEGVHVDSKNAAQDAFSVTSAAGHQANVTFQNSLVENMHGNVNGVHGDGFQTWGSMGDMHFYNLTVTTDYQAFFIAPQYSPTHKSADFENVNVKYTGPAEGSPVSYQYWFLDSKDEQAYPITLKNVYATERPGQKAEESSVWPKASLNDSTHAVRVGDQITWPGLPYKGAITVGSPASDFASHAKTGINYHGVSGLTATTGTGTTTPVDTTDHGTGSTGSTVPASTPAGSDATHESGAPTHWIASTDANAHVAGTDGNDQIAGVQGKVDVDLAGGKGDDTYIVDQPGDHVAEAAGQGTDTVMSYATTYTLPANVENLVLGGTGNSSGTGNDLANHITGNAGANVIDGGKGNDLLTGGAGADTFVIKAGEGNDTITDFQAGNAAGHDVVKLDGFSFASFDQVKAAMTQKGADVVLNLGNGQTLTLQGTTTAKLVAEDFQLVAHKATPAELLAEIRTDIGQLGKPGVDSAKMIDHIIELQTQLKAAAQPAPAQTTASQSGAMETHDAHHATVTHDHWS